MSVLGPILLLILINDIGKGLFIDVLKFADDAKIFNTVMNDVDHKSLQDDLQYCNEWCGP